jgi:anti-sigma B factor antagonist
MTPLAIDTEEHGGTTLLVLRGDLELNTAPHLREALVRAIAEGSRVVVDMEAVDFLDSAGLGILVGGLKRARERDGDLELVCSSRAVLRPLQLTGLDRAFTIHAGRDAALRLQSPHGLRQEEPS